MYHLHLIWMRCLGSLVGLCAFGYSTCGLDSLANPGGLVGLGIRLAAALPLMKGLRLANVGLAGLTAAANAGRVAIYPTFARCQLFNLTVLLALNGYSQLKVQNFFKVKFMSVP